MFHFHRILQNPNVPTSSCNEAGTAFAEPTDHSYLNIAQGFSGEVVC